MGDRELALEGGTCVSLPLFLPKSGSPHSLFLKHVTGATLRCPMYLDHLGTVRLLGARGYSMERGRLVEGSEYGDIILDLKLS